MAFFGIGLHPFVKQFTTFVTMILFVMLNFTSAVGFFPPELQDAFFRGLHSFWNGAGFVEATRPKTSESRVYWAITANMLRRLTGTQTPTWRDA